MAIVSRYALFAAFAVAVLSHPSSSHDSAGSNSSADLSGFARRVIELAASIGSDTFRAIDELVSETKDEELKADLNSCQTVYGIASYTLNKALLGLKNKSYVQVKNLIGSADAGVKCEDFFKKSKPVKQSPLTKRNAIFEQLRSAALSVVDLIM
ncbi:putative invertase inhibitor [Aristolochia californica]|uniref:putative invertase inhibitor n=1 Tax=Aristolochia californica TaxID=171875 RepID=UPI0035DF5C91